MARKANSPRRERRTPRDRDKPLVGVIMGSKSDWETMRHAGETLDALGVPHECQIVSAHRTPDWMAEYADRRRAAAWR